MPPYWFIVWLETGHDFSTSSNSKQYPDSPVHMLSDSVQIFFFHSGEEIKKCADSLPNSPDACGRKPNVKLKEINFINVKAGQDCNFIPYIVM